MQWQCSFPPDTPLRTYMMDAAEEDKGVLPDLRALLQGVAGVAPLAALGPECWEPAPAGPQQAQPGLVLETFLIVEPDVEVNVGGRTPSREEHLLIVALTGRDDCSPVVTCPLLLWDEQAGPGIRYVAGAGLAEARAGRRPGLLPVLLPRAGYDQTPRLFLSLLRPVAVPYRQVAAVLRHRPAALQLRAAAVPALQSALYRVARP